MINTMFDESLPLTVPEYEEWGNPNEKAAYDYMLSYSPYDQLEAKAYPGTPGEDLVQRQPGDVLGAGQICRPVAHVEDGFESTTTEDQYGRRSRWSFWSLRLASRDRIRIRLHALAGRKSLNSRQGAPGSRPSFGR